MSIRVVVLLERASVSVAVALPRARLTMPRAAAGTSVLVLGLEPPPQRSVESMFPEYAQWFVMPPYTESVIRFVVPSYVRACVRLSGSVIVTSRPLVIVNDQVREPTT